VAGLQNQALLKSNGYKVGVVRSLDFIDAQAADFW